MTREFAPKRDRSSRDLFLPFKPRKTNVSRVAMPVIGAWAFPPSACPPLARKKQLALIDATVRRRAERARRPGRIPGASGGGAGFIVSRSLCPRDPRRLIGAPRPTRRPRRTRVVRGQTPQRTVLTIVTRVNRRSRCAAPLCSKSESPPRATSLALPVEFAGESGDNVSHCVQERSETCGLPKGPSMIGQRLLRCDNAGVCLKIPLGDAVLGRSFSLDRDSCAN